MKKILLTSVLLTVTFLSFSMGKNYDANKVREMAKSPKAQAAVNKLEAFLVTTKGQKAAASEKTFVGSYYCLACHDGHKTWEHSFMTNGLKAFTAENSMIDKMGAVNDANQNGIDDFMDGLDMATTDAFAKYGENAPKLGYSAEDGYTVQIGEKVYQVAFGYGGNGKYKQRFVTKPMASDGQCAGHYVLPIQYNEATDEYVTYHTEKWYDDDNMPIYDNNSTKADFASSKSFDQGCAGCHYANVEKLYQTADGEWVAEAPEATLVPEGAVNYVDMDGDGIPNEINTGCERCHGGGSLHILGGGDASQIINPADLTAQERANLCGACHSRGKSLPDNLVSYPFDETNWKTIEIGQDPAEIYSDGGGYWGDGFNSSKHHQQYLDASRSAHMTNPFHKVDCSECHNPHLYENTAIITEKDITASGEVLGHVAVEEKDNSLCLSCHASYGPFEDLTKEMMLDYMGNMDAIAKTVSAHTNHPYAPTRYMGLSRCTTCHMAKTNKSAVPYDNTGHTLEVIPPQKTLDYTMPNSCSASCHSQKVNIFGLGIDPVLSDWSEQFDIDNANKLMKYFGDGGEWWDTTPATAKK